MYCYNSKNQQHSRLTDGFHAISNGSIDDIWPKMVKGETELEALVQLNQQMDVNELLHILQDRSQASVEKLPQTGISLQWEQLLSSIFICSENYGTRSSSLVLQHKNKIIKFVEAEYDVNGQEINQLHFDFEIIKS